MYYVAEKWSRESVEGKVPLTAPQAIAILRSNPSPYARKQVIDEDGRIVSVDELRCTLTSRKQHYTSRFDSAHQGLSQPFRQTPSIRRRLEVLEW